MVQQKSSDITCKKDESNWKAKVRDLEQKLSSAKNQIEQLSHALSDKDAQLNMESNNCNRLQLELSEAQQLALCLDDRVQENVQNAQLLQEFAASVWAKYQENLEILNTAMASLKAYGQRISFASGRMEMLQGLFARKEAMLKLQIEKGDIPERDVSQNVVEIEKQDSEESSYLCCELERVTQERDNLAAQIKQDSLTLDSKVLSIRAQVEEEIETLKQTKSDLEGIVQDKSQKCVKLSEKLEKCENDLDYANQNIEELKTSLGRQELNMQQILEEQRHEVENQFSDRLADMDRQINEAKREHAKAVVSVRQLERQMTREKERFTEQLSTTEEHYKRQLDLLQGQLKAVEKERNLMMATLRQEGLVGKLKSERLEPVTHNWDRDEELVRDHTEPVSSTVVTYSQPEIQQETDEALTTVLEDLKSLTDAVLKDDNSETDSENDL
ncbi:coiled-coil alpha-helical rod protein 1-like [Mercenaria mercenaria]|uniref:coiled-coil alpha-helical rod protein 1-like n=1 Tax=Mercenaria mercenaria TaxID=6596 RepID=UPI00234E6861|nr:coiled-coil alpha-helical rod protein 1-like [Mercenaria mercenaria]